MVLRFGLLGAGRIGKVHAKAVTSDANAKLVAVADAMPAAADASAKQYGCEVRTIDAILAAKDIDAVVICTPTDKHADLIEHVIGIETVDHPSDGQLLAFAKKYFVVR